MRSEAKANQSLGAMGTGSVSKNRFWSLQVDAGSRLTKAQELGIQVEDIPLESL